MRLPLPISASVTWLLVKEKFLSAYIRSASVQIFSGLWVLPLDRILFTLV
jgi:hypothetical protein